MDGHGFRHVVADVGDWGVQSWALSYRDQERAQATFLICLAEARYGPCRLWV